MVSLIWACSAQRHYQPKLFHACAAKVLEVLADPKTADSLAPITIAMLVYSFASHTVEAEDKVCLRMVRKLCDKALEHLDQFEQQVKNI